MATLSFSKIGATTKYMSTTITGVSSATIQLHFSDDDRHRVTFQRTINETDGWATFADMRITEIWCDTISGFASGEKVRIICDANPSSATIVTA